MVFGEVDCLDSLSDEIFWGQNIGYLFEGNFNQTADN